MPRREEIWLREMRDDARQAHSYTIAVDYVAFRGEQMRVDATVRQLEIVGEACKSVSQETRDLHPAVAWRALARTRDRLIHAYFSVDVKTVWNIAHNDMPTLVIQLDAMLNPQPQGDNQGDHNGPTH